MSLDAYELEKRIACANRSDTARGIFFNAVLAELESTVGPEAKNAAVAEVGARGWVDFFWYPAADFLKLLYVGTNALEAKVGSRDQAIFNLGRAATRHFFSSAVGKTLRLFVIDGKPESLLSSAPAAYDIGVNYGKRKFELVEKKCGTLTVVGDPVPNRFHEGVIAGALEEIECKGTVTSKARSLNSAEYHVRWN